MNNGSIETITVKEAQQDLASLLERVSSKGERVVIAEDGMAIAALIPAEVFERFQRWDRDLAERRRFLDEFRKNFEGVPPEEIEREVEKALAEVRAEMRAERLAALNAE